ncbi:hypothetical protein HCH54_004592 [Aspergillus fumigatus]
MDRKEVGSVRIEELSITTATEVKRSRYRTMHGTGNAGSVSSEICKYSVGDLTTHSNPAAREFRARPAYDTSLAFKQPHQLWLKPWRRIQYNFKTSCPNHEAFQGITRLGFVPVPPNNLGWWQLATTRPRDSAST